MQIIGYTKEEVETHAGLAVEDRVSHVGEDIPEAATEEEPDKLSFADKGWHKKKSQSKCEDMVGKRAVETQNYWTPSGVVLVVRNNSPIDHHHQ